MRTFVIALMFTILSMNCAFASVLGTVGRVYEIAEKDAVKEMQQKALEVDWQKYFAGAAERAKKWRPELQVSLPRSDKNETRLVDVSYTLEEDVPLPDGSGTYPKGYVINPLELTAFPETMVVINGSDREQVQWFKKSQYKNDPSVFVLLTDGDFADLEKELKRPVYFATSQITDKFSIRSVPSVARQSGKMMEVSEFEIPPKNKSQKNP